MKKIRGILLVLCLGIFAFSAFQLITIYKNYRIGDALYEEIAEETVQIEWPETTQEEPMDIETKTEGEKKKTEPNVSVDFAHLKSVNTDIIGWLCIQDTVINYPLLKGSDNSKYLKASYDGKSSYFGSIFMDFRNEGNFKETHSILYGHNMKNGSMFGTLKRYADEGYYKKHKYIYVFTEEATYKYKVVSMYVTKATDETYTIFFAKEQDYLEYLSRIAKSSYVDTKEVLQAEDKLLTLSTCTSSGEDKRFVVHAKLVKEIPVKK